MRPPFTQIRILTNEPRAPEPWEEEVAHDLVALADDNIEDFLVRKKKR